MRLDVNDFSLWIGSCDLFAVLPGHFERCGHQDWQRLWPGIFGCDELACCQLAIGHNLSRARIMDNLSLASLGILDTLTVHWLQSKHGKRPTIFEPGPTQ